MFDLSCNSIISIVKDLFCLSYQKVFYKNNIDENVDDIDDIEDVEDVEDVQQYI
jgi:hypothetical protein